MNNLHLTQLGANMTEVRYGDKYVLFSYQTPVSYVELADMNTVYVTDKKYSATTSKHISKWVAARKIIKVNQETIDNIVR